MTDKNYTAIGLMSGTSADGIDAALITTDGLSHIEVLPYHHHYPYSEAFRKKLLDAMQNKGDILALEHELTSHHSDAVRLLLEKASLPASAVDVIGFHGQTIYHNPEKKLTWQIGDGAKLAYDTGCNVVCDFRRTDIAAGGEGAPLVPVYHQGIAQSLGKPIVFLNIGGVSNVTYIDQDEQLLAFDCGPGNALIDDWIYRHTGQSYDKYGEIAASGQVHQDLLKKWLSHPYFKRLPPKSLDRNSFVSLTDNTNLSLADGAATLTAFTAKSIENANRFFHQQPKHWYVCGGGRHNDALMKQLAAALSSPIAPVESLSIDGDMLEAQAFAYLAVRRLLELPITFPGTTAAPHALAGGAVYLASNA